MIFGVFPSKTATAEFVVPVRCRLVTISLHATYPAELTQIDTNNLPLHLLITTSGLPSSEGR